MRSRSTRTKCPRRFIRLRALSGEQLTNVIDMFGAFQAPRVSFSRWRLSIRCTTADSSVVYLRAMGGTVPEFMALALTRKYRSREHGVGQNSRRERSAGSASPCVVLLPL